MKTASTKAALKRELKRLFRSMDFVSRHPALAKDGPEADRFAEIYQQLGMVWEFLALQCRHEDGYRNAEKKVCRICGKIEGMPEHWLLLPGEGKKAIGRRTKPNSKKTFANQQQATVLTDAIDFHGTKLRVAVHNSYRSALFRDKSVTIAADRIVQLEEGGIECWFDTNLVRVELLPRDRQSGLPYSAFPSELSRKQLERFPVLLEYDKRGRFVGLTVFKPRKASRPGATL